MRIGILLPTVFVSKHWGEGRIFAPGGLAVALADGLVLRGHDVTFYSSADVTTKARLVPGNEKLTDDDLTYFQFRNREKVEQQYSTIEIIKRDFEYGLTLKAYQDAQQGKLDIIHSFHDFGAHYFSELTGFPTVYTTHDPMPNRTDTIEFHRFQTFAHHKFISISNSQRRGIVPVNFIMTVYNGLDISQYDFQPNPGNHLIHFGRMMEDKGSDVAIEAAKKAGFPIQIATSSIRGNRSQAFYDAKIAPEINGSSVQVVGFLKAKAKSEYIGMGKAFLFPLQWEEPFGLVMIEAMACGTPVVAYNRGSVAEIVKDGVTGFIVDPERGVDGLVEAIRKIGQIDRAACRKHVEDNFTVEKMVEGYEEVYKKVLASK